jgi:L-alanine-DL-glutamate epimerase-like enolase superfamily enzyme
LPTASLHTANATYARVAELALRIERCELLPLVRDVSGGFTKVSTVVRLSGDGHEGLGEDITWDQIDQLEQLRHAGDLSWLRGTRSFDEFSTLVGLADLFPVEPIRDNARYYRRWAFESAALDLALRQSGLSLAHAVGRSAAPVSFVVSTGLGEPASLEPLHELRRRNPSLRFKLDPTPSWGPALLAELAALDCVDVIDMKGRYDNVSVAMAADAELYRRVFQALPSAWIEDPAVAEETAELLESQRDRISWDEPIHTPDAARAEPQALAVRQCPTAVRHLRPLRGARHRSLRRGDVRAGSRPGPAAVPRVPLSSRRAERPRPGGVQHALRARRPAGLPAGGAAPSDRLSLGVL